MKYVVGYFEVLNMQFAGTNTDLYNVLLTAFIRPIRFIAADHPELKFEIFPDSIVLGCDTNSLTDFVQILQRLFRNWSTNYLLVRGGVVSGEADIIGSAFEKQLIKELSGISMWRFTGPAVAAAYHLTETINAGMNCLLSEEIADLTKEIAPDLIASDSAHRFIWPDRNHLESYIELYSNMLNKNEVHLLHMRNHIEATILFIHSLEKSKR